jgi:hypothetical protein
MMSAKKHEQNALRRDNDGERHVASKDFHLSDEQLLRHIDGEVSAGEGPATRGHLEWCRQCRARRHELESASLQFVRSLQPEHEAARALLLARLGRLASSGEPSRWPKAAYWAKAAAVVIVAVVSFAVFRSRSSPTVVYNLPDSSLTPGAAVPINRAVLCSQETAGNKAVPASMQRKVFEEYRIAGADPQAYEVDYLITPALGGADDIHNLWPQAYSTPIWNARAKDALEDRLRDMVCDGGIELGEAQHEIATNWIAAYKKYFHTEGPFVQDGKARE